MARSRADHVRTDLWRSYDLHAATPTPTRVGVVVVAPPLGGTTPTTTTGQFAARHPILAVSTPRARKGQRGQGDRLRPEATRRHEAGVERPEVPAERHGLPTNCDGRWQQASLQLLRRNVQIPILETAASNVTLPGPCGALYVSLVRDILPPTGSKSKI